MAVAEVKGFQAVEVLAGCDKINLIRTICKGRAAYALSFNGSVIPLKTQDQAVAIALFYRIKNEIEGADSL